MGGDPDPESQPPGHGALESPDRTPSPPKCVPVPERSGRNGLPEENLAPECWGAPRSSGHPGNTGPGSGGRPTLWGRVLLGSGPPLVPPAGQGLEEGKKRVDSS